MRVSRDHRIAVAAGAGIGAAVTVWRRWAHTGPGASSVPADRAILIVGAGFAGMTVAHRLSKLLGAREGQIHLIDQNNFLLFTPMLTEVAGSELDARHVVAPARLLAECIAFEQGAVREIDLANKSVVLDAGPEGSERRTLEAGHLVIALGSVSDYHGIPGVKEHSLSLKSINDALAIRNRVLGALEKANWERDPEVRRKTLTFVVGGGGYTGVEIMAAVNALVRSTAREYPNVAPEDVTAIIVEPGGRLMPELSPALAEFGQRELEKRGVQVRLKTKIASAGPDFVELDTGERIATGTFIWSGGVTPHPLVKQLGCELGKHGGIVVDRCFAVPGYPGVWAIGDCAEVPRAAKPGSYPKTAQVATREGDHLARNIVAAMRGQAPRPFTFKPIGELALVGRHSGVGRVFGLSFSGLAAWMLWRGVYLAKMPGMAQRVRIAIDWTLDMIFGRNIARIPLSR